MVVIVTGCTLFVTSQDDVIFTFANHCFGEVCWHNMHIILHALSLLVVIQCVIAMNINYINAPKRYETGAKHSTQC